ncbi:MAG: hypothetical protein MUF49_24230 [Oculatellaceae cyanobacterium Prado106]|jgi:tetratricopeptide (TPR) repeat protein|nr:hypothetical protein [Oculatellaceae cyanobacterium Prado106]
MNIKKWWNQASESKALAEQAMEFADRKQLDQAIQQAKQAISLWSKSPNLLERKFCQITMGQLLYQLTEQIRDWQQAIAYAQQLVIRAEFYESKLEDPLIYTDLMIALSLYEQATLLNRKPEYREAIKRCHEELTKRQRYESLLHQARQQESIQFFREANKSYSHAIQIYDRPEVHAAIENCSVRMTEESEYEQTLQSANQIAQRGDFVEAIALAKPATEKFVRADSQAFLTKLNRIVRAKEQFRCGLVSPYAKIFTN